MKEILAMLERIMDEGLERVFGLYYSSYMGFVADNEDPEGYGRIKVIIPFISKDKPIPKWAWQKNRYSGKNYGSWNVPEKGDTVWVEFERGNLSYPIWSYGYHGKGELEPEWKITKDKWFRTPDGFHVRWKAEDKTMEIVNPEGTSFVINKNLSLVTDQKIFLGGLDQAAEPALLGDKTEKTLNDIKDCLSDIRDTLAEVASVDAGIASSLGLTYPVKYGETAASVTSKLIELTNSINQIKSQKVKLD